jgi:energy-coupling factor transporter ATP-binding protein EcfA2
MIERLDLEEYGKFKKRSLEFGPFTVVCGPNEAGKTTVFDALFDALCAESRHEGRPAWKTLADRYGALRKSVLTWKGEPFSFGYEEFLEIFAIRAGDANVNAVGGKSWETAAENRLLNAGLNPAGLAAALIDKAENSRKHSAQARLKELRRLIKAREAELEEHKGKRDAIFAGEAETARLEAELKEHNAGLHGRQAELSAINAQVDALAEACRLQTALDGIKALRDFEETAKGLERLAGFETNDIPVYRALMAEKQERERAIASAEAAIAERRAAAGAARAAAGQLAEREPILQRQVQTAEVLLARLAAYAAEPPKLVLSVVKPMRYGIWAGALALALFVAFSGGKALAYGAAVAIAAAGAWVGLKLSIKETQVGHTPEETKAFLDGLAVEWAMVSPDPLPADMEAARAVFAKPGADHAALVEAYNNKAAEVGDLEAGIAPLEANLAEATRAAKEAAAGAESWLQGRSCATEDEYQAKIAERAKLASRAADLGERLKVFRLRYACEGDDQLKDKLFTEKEALDRRGVDPAKADEQALERVKQQAAAAGDDVRNRSAEAAAVKSALEKAQAVAGAKLESLPASINRADTEIAAAKEEIAALELQVQAYMLAAEVFNKLAERSTVAFELLAKETAALLELALPGTQAQFGSFDAGEASLKDAGGKLRRVSNLSSGTRDLFMLGARLLMARKARTGPEGAISPALLVLDDPFYTLDPQREQAALRLLMEFQRETGWQIIILTKDITLAKNALTTDHKVKIVEL